MKMKKAVRMPLRRPPQRSRSAGAPMRARTATVDETYDEDDDYGAEEEPNMKFSHALFVVLILHLIAVGGVLAFNWMKTRQGAEAPVAKAPAAEKPVASAAASPKTGAPAKPAASSTAKAPAVEGWNGRVHIVEPGDTLIQIAATYKTSVMAIEKENGITSTSILRVGQALKIPGTEKTAATGESSAAKEAFLASRTNEPSAGTISAVPRSTPAAKTATAKPAEVKPAVAKPAESKAPAASAIPDVYVVAKGDNPYTIAKKFGVSYTRLLEVNNIKDATKVQIGQKLKIPKN
jgi:Tfp pilus assembly protein FimV